jgi:hypothetical protein
MMKILTLLAHFLVFKINYSIGIIIMFIKKQQHTLINTDLANGRLSIIIPLYSEPKKSKIANEMVQKFKALDEIKYKTSEQNLFLLCLSANLVLYFYNGHGIFNCSQSPEISLYDDKMNFYYKVTSRENFPLLPIQKAAWHALIGEVYYKINHYEAALTSYECAIAKYSLQEKNILTDLTIQKYHLALIESYLKLAYRYLTDTPAPALALDRINTAIELINEMIQVGCKKISSLYFFKAQALVYLSYLYKNKEEKLIPATIKLIEALQIYIIGYENLKSSKIKAKFFQHIDNCGKKLVKIAVDLKIDSIKFTIGDLKNSLKNINADKLGKIKIMLSSLIFMLEPKALFLKETANLSQNKENQLENQSDSKLVVTFKP